MGWFHGGAVDGDRRAIKGYPALHGEMLSTAVQQQLLGTINWAGVLSSSNLAVVVHERPPEAQDDQGRSAPLVASRPPCYQEFIVHSVLVERAALSSTTVRVMIIAKTWRDQTSPVETHSMMADEKVNLGADDLKEVEASLKDGFVASIEKVLKSNLFQQRSFTRGGK